LEEVSLMIMRDVYGAKETKASGLIAFPSAEWG